MRRNYLWSCVLVISSVGLLTSLSSYGQSLGDIARANREKQQAEDASAVPPKVITNADLPKNTNPPSSDAPAQTNATSNKSDHRAVQQTLAEQRAAEQWRNRILTQKQKMANLQAHIDQLNASMQAANGSAQFDGPSGRGQARQMQQVMQIQLRLDEQRRTLLEMQEAARRAGMHSAVYDP
jgi:hypothetical protein